MLRFAWYELKAMFRYSSGAKRRRLSLLGIIFTTLFIAFEVVALKIRLGYDLFLLVRRYKLASIGLRSAALLGGGAAVTIGRVSHKAKELIYSSPITNAELFIATYIVSLFNILPAIVPLLLLIYFSTSPLVALAYTFYFFYFSLVGFSLIGPAKSYKEAFLRSLIFIALLAFTRFTNYLDFFDRSLLYLDNLYGLLMPAIFAPAIKYGIDNARDVISRSEALIKLGKYKGNLATLYLARYPQLALFIAMPPITIVLNVLLAPAVSLFDLLSIGTVVPILTVVMMLYGLSRELGRRDLRLAAPNDRIAFRTRAKLVGYSIVLSSFTVIGVIVRQGVLDPYIIARGFSRTLGAFTFSSALGAYYSAGACRPIKGSLTDAFKAPLAKQLFIAIVIGMFSLIISAIVIFAAAAYSLDIIASLGLAGVGYYIFLLSEKKFLKRARR